MKSRLSPQKEIIVRKLRDMDWHCGSEWLNGIKDDRIRITELNRGYMKEKGYQILGEPCKGKACGRQNCPLFMRRAEKIGEPIVKSKPTFNLVMKEGRMVAEMVNI